jgi:antitoxin CcdA
MRMAHTYVKRPINLTLDAGLVETARAYGLNLSAVAEEALRCRIAQETARRWKHDNHHALESQRADIDARGLLSDDVTGWWTQRDGSV